jgi:hypothetical protein
MANNAPASVKLVCPKSKFNSAMNEHAFYKDGT